LDWHDWLLLKGKVVIYLTVKLFVV
jgi:hypothetical protein